MKSCPRKHSSFTAQFPSLLLATKQLRAIEEHFQNLPLMARAGAAAAEHVMARFPKPGIGNGAIVVLCGQGNNGGDGLVAARHLMSKGYTVYLIAPVVDKFQNDAQQAYRAFLDYGGKRYETPSSIAPDFSFPLRPSLIIDALFGIGLTRAPAAPFCEWIQWANHQSSQNHVPILSLDIASGLESDTGIAHAPTVTATDTLNFIAFKPGELTLDGPDHSGNLHLATLDLPEEIARESAGLLRRQTLADILPKTLLRHKENTHKGSYGTLGIIGGAEGMIGAPILSGRAALHLGVGKIHIGFISENIPAFDPLYPELMLHTADTLLSQQYDALVIGGGLGVDNAAKQFLEKALSINTPLVLDADALNTLARHIEFAEQLRQRAAPTVLTPHPAEAARLLQCVSADIQRDRIASARTIARHFNAHTLLKGCGSIIAAPDGAYAINTTGNPALAFGGSGDLLSGMIGALLAQSPDAEAALCFAVCLHGAAADQWALDHGRAGFTGASLLAMVDKIIHELSLQHGR